MTPLIDPPLRYNTKVATTVIVILLSVVLSICSCSFPSYDTNADSWLDPSSLIVSLIHLTSSFHLSPFYNSPPRPKPLEIPQLLCTSIISNILYLKIIILAHCLHFTKRSMKPDTGPNVQEVRQAFAEKATRPTRICRELRQLQSSQEGLGEPPGHTGRLTNTRIAHQTAERYTNPPTAECFQYHFRKP